MQRTKIEYLTHTWSPIAMRCTPASEGCANCWHLRMANRLSKNTVIGEVERLAYAGGEPVLSWDELKAPARLRKPAIIGTMFMGDLFHDSIHDDWIVEIHKMMAKAEQHTFVLLTKRPKRALQFYNMRHSYSHSANNIWFGVSVENQRNDDRIIDLHQIMGFKGKKFVSFEPLIGPFNFLPPMLRWINLAIVGAETGPKARPMKLEWARSLRDQCKSANIPFFMKAIDAKKSPLPDDLNIRELPI